MRITFVTPALDLSGGQRVIAAHAERLHARGHRVTVVAPPHRSPTARDVARSLLRDRRWPRRPTANHLDGTGVERRTLARPRPVTAADLPDADVVVATWWETAEWVADLPAAKGAKVYFLQHHEVVFDPANANRIDATWRLPMRKVVVARWLADLARDRFGDPAARVVPNAVDADLFHAPPRGKRPEPTVGLMYATPPFKGCDVALAAVRIAGYRLPGLRVRAFGHYPPAADLPLPAGAEYAVAPPQAAIRDAYAGCDAWLFASRCEGFGLPVLEAMACRTPVIGTPAGAAPELLAGGGGILVKPENPLDMADAIVRICRMSDGEWRGMSDAAHATAAGYTWDDAADLFEAAVYEAAGRRPAGV
jgi:glycosyltransferase involved in cell wall biosynthesis